MSAASYLSYGGILKVVRADGTTLNNANAAVGYAATTSAKIKNYDEYNSTWSDDTVEFIFAAKNPGRWANDLKVCTIDNKADQILGINTTDVSGIGFTVGYGITSGLSGVDIPGNGTVVSFDGYLKAIVTGVSTDAINGNSTVDVKIVSRVSTAGTEYNIDYAQGNAAASFEISDSVFPENSSSAQTVVAVQDWYDQQTLGLTNSTIFWKSLAPKPTSSNYVLERNGKNDEIHVVIVDDTGSVTGIQGNILEKHLGLSKAKDAVSNVNAPQKIYYKNYLADFSDYIYSGNNPSDGHDAYWGTTPVATGFSTAFTQYTVSEGLWGQDAQDVIFSALGGTSYNFSEGEDYSSTGGMTSTLADLITAYGKFENADEIEVDYLINGPSMGSESESQAKANYLISLANQRKDCIAVISPYKGTVVGETNTTTQTENIIKFFSTLSSSSYAVFDSGYKYTYDRFNNMFRYIPCNADIAGLMHRTNIVAYPWFSPAGQQRGILNNAVKLAYNPTKAQRDQLYTARVNSIVTQPGIGILLFGDKTALGYASAFDRINVRRLFLTIEQALERTAQAQLFELNDQITRSNFVNIVEPYLRDIQAKRGLYDFLVICDETNNTPDVIDNNEFRADIFLKPTKSINYVTLTFVATRTGVSFEEVAGRV